MTVTITFARPTVRTRLAEMLIYTRLGESADIDEMRLYQLGVFVPLLTRATIEGDLGFSLPAPTAPAAELEAGLQTFLDADEALYDAIQEALARADAIPNEPEVQPGEKKA